MKKSLAFKLNLQLTNIKQKQIEPAVMRKTRTRNVSPQLDTLLKSSG